MGDSVLLYVLGYALLFGLLGVAFWLPGLVLGALVLPARDVWRLRRLAEVSLGLTAWTAWLFLLAATGQLRWSGVVSFAGLWLIAAVLLRPWIASGRASGDGFSPGWANRLLGIALPALVVVPCFIVALGPGLAWDASTYHLTLPKLYLAHGGFRPVEMSLYANWPLNVELLFAVAMLVKDYILATALHCGFGVLTLYAIHVLCRLSSRPGSALLAVMLFLTNVIVVWEMTVAYIDLAYTFFFVAAFVFLFAAQQDATNRRIFLLMAGLGCGMLAGTKVTGFLGAVVLLAVMLPGLLATRTGSRRAELKALVMWFVLPAVVLALPWAAKAAWYTGNPVYPFLHSWLGGPDWSDALAAQFAAWHKGMGMGRSPVDYLLLPFRVILCGRMGEMSYAHFDGRIWPAWIALVPLTLLLGTRLPLVRRCMAAAGLYFALWAVSSQQIRFLIPILPLLSVAAAVSVYEGAARLRAERWRRALPAVCLVVAVAAALHVNIGNDIVAGRLLSSLRRDGVEEVRLSAVEPVFTFANEHLPRDARVLMLNTNQAFLLDREYLADSCFEASQITDWLRSAEDCREVRQRLAGRGITHVLSMRNKRGAAYPPALWELLADPAQARSLYRSPDGAYELWELTGG